VNEENQSVRLKRLLYRSWHRGCKETDVILGYFAESHLGELSPDELDIYEAMLEEQDADIWNWLVKKSSPPKQEYEPILAILRHFAAERHGRKETAS